MSKRKIQRKIIDVAISKGKSKSYNTYLFKLDCGHVEVRGYSVFVDVKVFCVLQNLNQKIGCSDCSKGENNEQFVNWFNRVKIGE